MRSTNRLHVVDQAFQTLAKTGARSRRGRAHRRHFLRCSYAICRVSVLNRAADHRRHPSPGGPQRLPVSGRAKAHARHARRPELRTALQERYPCRITRRCGDALPAVGNSARDAHPALGSGCRLQFFLGSIYDVWLEGFLVGLRVPCSRGGESPVQSRSDCSRFSCRRRTPSRSISGPPTSPPRASPAASASDSASSR